MKFSIKKPSFLDEHDQRIFGVYSKHESGRILFIACLDSESKAQRLVNMLHDSDLSNFPYLVFVFGDKGEDKIRILVASILELFCLQEGTSLEEISPYRETAASKVRELAYRTRELKNG